MALSLHRGVPAPLNARPALIAPATWRAGKPLVLATAPRSGTPSAHIAMRERAWASAGHERIELTPAIELAPSTVYELQSDAGVIVGVFTTGTRPDTTPPSWVGLTSGRLWQPPKRGGVVRIPMECGDDLVFLESRAAATDDQTPAPSLRYALWAGDPKSPLDYKSPPLTWTTVPETPRHLYLSFGTTEESLMDFDLPKTRPLKIGVKVIDLAGNGSPASELTLN